MSKVSGVSQQLTMQERLAEIRQYAARHASGGAFAGLLRNILGGDASTYSSIQAQLMLGGQFLNTMDGDSADHVSGHTAQELARLSDASMLMDSLLGEKNEHEPTDLLGGMIGGMPAGAQTLATMLSALEGAHATDKNLSQEQMQQSRDAKTVDSVEQDSSEMAQPVASSTASPLRDAAEQALAEKSFGSKEAADLAGLLAARFESNGNPGVIGYDRHGGTSYGLYQISSRAGTFDSFLTFLSDREPEWASDLRAAGRANTGSKYGPVPSVWRRIAKADGQHFSDLQHEFIKQTHFMPAAEKLAALTGIDLRSEGGVLGQVLWSTAVQHGASGSVRIFAEALDAIKGASAGNFDMSLIKEIYKTRGKQFSSSTPRVQAAVQDRFSREMELALNMLGDSSLA